MPNVLQSSSCISRLHTQGWLVHHETLAVLESTAAEATHLNICEPALMLQAAGLIYLHLMQPLQQNLQTLLLQKVCCLLIRQNHQHRNRFQSQCYCCQDHQIQCSVLSQIMMVLCWLLAQQLRWSVACCCHLLLIPDHPLLPAVAALDCGTKSGMHRG